MPFLGLVVAAIANDRIINFEEEQTKTLWKKKNPFISKLFKKSFNKVHSGLNFENFYIYWESKVWKSRRKKIRVMFGRFPFLCHTQLLSCINIQSKFQRKGQLIFVCKDLNILRGLTEMYV